jgi:ATP-binding cassette subfamily C (CFTR/MRP) protein 4
LESDLKIFPQGDQTVIGERGITVSGGQKARLSLARAVYSRSDIYLLDDPISAVDAKVARRIYNYVIKGILKDKTVLLVSHQVHYMSGCDQVIIMDNGSVSKMGTPQELNAELRKLVIAEEDAEGDKSNNALLAI